MSFICGGERLSSSDDEEIRERTPDTVRESDTVIQSPYSSWLTSQMKSREEKFRATSNRSNISEEESGRNQFLSDQEMNDDQLRLPDLESYSQSTTAANDSVINGDDSFENDNKNPFATESVEDYDNPFHDSYDSSKNPFCCN